MSKRLSPDERDARDLARRLERLREGEELRGDGTLLLRGFWVRKSVKVAWEVRYPGSGVVRWAKDLDAVDPSASLREERRDSFDVGSNSKGVMHSGNAYDVACWIVKSKWLLWESPFDP
jgi:hypothetical protein